MKREKVDDQSQTGKNKEKTLIREKCKKNVDSTKSTMKTDQLF